MTTSQRLRASAGFAMIPTLIVLVIILGLGAAVLATVNVQSHQTRVERAGEASFNLAESVLDNEATQLERVWPGSSSLAYPACNQSSTLQTNPQPGCPGTTLNTNFSQADAGADFASTPTWNVQVLDDTGGALYYSDSLVGTAPAWDSNGDGAVWIRADTTVGGQRRIVIGQMIEQTSGVTLPPASIISGGFATSNNGRKVIAYTQNPNKAGGLVGKILVRCGNSSTTPSYGNSCLGYSPSKGQVSPANTYQAGYVDPSGTGATLNTNTMSGMKAYAISQGTYYPAGTCPTSLTGALVYIENANCSYTTGTFNSSTSPGAVVIATGTLTLQGNVTYYGIIYAANGQGTMPSSPPCTASYQNTVITTLGTALIQGAVFIDKCGTYSAGASATNLIFDPSGLSGLKALTTPALAKNTFRVLANP